MLIREVINLITYVINRMHYKLKKNNGTLCGGWIDNTRYTYNHKEVVYMGKTNKKMWADRFYDLEPEDQLELAKMIIEELDLNVEVYKEDVEVDCLDDWPEGYDIEGSRNTEDAFRRFMATMETKSELESAKHALLGYKNLSKESKEIVHNELIDVINEQLEIKEQEDKEAVCRCKGHNFTKWKHNTWTTYEDGWIDHQFVNGMPSEHEDWTRTCTRCGYEEESKTEPKKVREERIQRENNERIEELEKELNELKGKTKVKVKTR